MAPSTDYRKMSLIPDIARSQSDSSYEGLAFILKDKRGRRCSEWSGKEDSKKMVLRPLQLNNEEQHRGLLYRRLSRTAPINHPTSQSMVSETAAVGVTRSHSVKSVKKMVEARQRHRGSSIPSEVNHHGSKVKVRTVSNRSLPLPGDESDYLRLRNFSVTSKGIVNRGDSFRSKSSSNVPMFLNVVQDTAASHPITTEPAPLTLSEESRDRSKRAFKVLLIGASGVGKSSMWTQFMTSEYICGDGSGNEKDLDQMITVILNNEESQMEFDEKTVHGENAHFTRSESSDPDAYVIVYSVTDRKSYSQARQVLAQLERLVDAKAVILVANKTDLARLRVVTTEEGRSLAKDKGCKFIETSVAINHQIDELLVGTLSQIRIKAKLRKKRDSQQSCNRKSSLYSGSRASGVLKKILRRACLTSKSCDNLHVL